MSAYVYVIAAAATRVFSTESKGSTRGLLLVRRCVADLPFLFDGGHPADADETTFDLLFDSLRALCVCDLNRPVCVCVGRSRGPRSSVGRSCGPRACTTAQQCPSSSAPRPTATTISAAPPAPPPAGRPAAGAAPQQQHPAPPAATSPATTQQCSTQQQHSKAAVAQWQRHEHLIVVLLAPNSGANSRY